MDNIDFVYHGSTIGGLKTIEPRKTHLKDIPIVFAATTEDVALSFLAPWDDTDFEHGSKNNKMYMREKTPGAFDKWFKGKKGFIYKLNADSFETDEEITGYEVFSKSPVDVASVKEIPDALEALKQSSIELIPYVSTQTIKGGRPMDKRLYFLGALRAGAYLRKEWILSVFSVTRVDGSPAVADRYPFKLLPPLDPKNVANGYYRFVNPDHVNDDSLAEVISGSVKDQPLFRFKEPIKLKAGDVPNLKKDIETTYGNVLFNMMVLVWPFGDKVEFQEGRVNGFKLDNHIASRLQDTPPAGAPRDNKYLYVDEFLKYMEAMSSLAGLAPLCAPAASPKSMTVDPAIIKRRDELFEQYKDQLNDKAILSKIEKELVDMDRATFKGDPAEDFYIKDKTFNVARKRSFIDFGAESGFSDSGEAITIKKSLQEGWDVDNLPAMADTLRAGSYNRGAETALGGESVKYFYRVFQNTKVAEEDCGTLDGLYWTITEDNFKLFEGLYRQYGGKSVLLTLETLKPLVGSKILVRSPMMCKTEAPSFCAKCIGEAFSRAPTGLHIAASNVGSAFMLASMRAMHGKALQTKKYDFKQAIS